MSPVPRVPPVAPAPVSSLGGVTNPAILGAAQADSLVRFGPQENALKRLMTQAYSDLLSRVSIARSTAAGVQQVASLVKPAMEQAYARAGSTVENAGKDLEDDLDHLGKAADPFRAATMREAGGARTRLAEGMAGALSELESRRMDAAAGGMFAVNKAYEQFGSDKADVSQKWLEVQGSKGANTVAAAGQMEQANRQAAADAAKERRISEDAALGRDVTMRGQDLAHADRQAAARAGGGGAGGRMTPAKNTETTQSIEKVWSFLRPYSPTLRSKLLGQIKTGVTSIKVGTRTLKLPSVPSPVYAQAAYDLLATSRLGSGTYHQLKGYGYTPHPRWMPARPVPARRVFGRPVGTIRGRA